MAMSTRSKPAQDSVLGSDSPNRTIAVYHGRKAAATFVLENCAFLLSFYRTWYVWYLKQKCYVFKTSISFGYLQRIELSNLYDYVLNCCTNGKWLCAYDDFHCRHNGFLRLGLSGINKIYLICDLLR